MRKYQIKESFFCFTTLDISVQGHWVLYVFSSRGVPGVDRSCSSCVRKEGDLRSLKRSHHLKFHFHPIMPSWVLQCINPLMISEPVTFQKHHLSTVGFNQLTYAPLQEAFIFKLQYSLRSLQRLMSSEQFKGYFLYLQVSPNFNRLQFCLSSKVQHLL